MCGRFGLFAALDDLAEQFNFAPDLVRDDYRPRWNIPPTAPALTVHNGAGRDAAAARVPRILRWGMTAGGAMLSGRMPGAAAARPLFNARAETIGERPAFRDAFRQRRCLIPANGFYEWRRGAARGQAPVWFHRADGAAAAFAGIWTTSHTAAGPVDACAVITCAANRLVAPIHHRMPVILPPEQCRLWLAKDLAADTLLTLLRPAEWPEMACHPVAAGVNRVGSDGPCLVRPVSQLL